MTTGNNADRPPAQWNPQLQMPQEPRSSHMAPLSPLGSASCQTRRPLEDKMCRLSPCPGEAESLSSALHFHWSGLSHMSSSKPITDKVHRLA